MGEKLTSNDGGKRRDILPWSDLNHRLVMEIETVKKFLKCAHFKRILKFFTTLLSMHF